VGGGGTKTVTQQQPQLSPEASALTQIGAQQTQMGLENAPITQFQGPNIEQIAGVDPATLDALRYYQSLIRGDHIPGVLEAFNRLQLPLIQQQAMQAGLGHSGALVNAEAMGQAAALMPALQMQSEAAGSEAKLGDYLRQIEQQGLSAPYQDFLRRQGITESLLSGATGLIPSTIGQSGTSATRTGGLLGALFGGGAK
jgi:hypothetical protein